MHIIEQQTVECGECKGKDFEYVTYHNSRFMRCRKCGHEGTKSNVIPEMGTGSVSNKNEAIQHRTF